MKKQTKKPSKAEKPAPVKKEEPKNLEPAKPAPVKQEAPRAKEETKAAPDVLIREAKPSDVVAAKPQAALPTPGAKEKLFECPQGCLKVGPIERMEDYCSIHGCKTNPKR